MYPPLEHAGRILSERGLAVRYLGVRDAQGPPFELPSTSGESRYLRRTASGPLRFITFNLWVAWSIAWWRPSVIYVSDLRACLAGAVASLLTKRFVVYHEHDAPTSGTRGLVFRRWLIGHADLIIVPNVSRKLLLDPQVPDDRCAVVWNVPCASDVASSRSPRSTAEWVIVYQGSIVPPRLPLVVLDALAELPPDVKLHIIGYETSGHQGYLRRFMQVAAELGLTERVRYLGPLARAKLLQKLDQADVGLALSWEDATDQNLATLPGASVKVFEYMARGVPVLVPASPEWNALIVSPGYGLSCDPSDAVSIRDACRALYDDRTLSDAIGKRSVRRIRESWNYEAQCKPTYDRLLGRVFPLERAE